MAATVAVGWRTDSAIVAVPAAAAFGVLMVGHWALDWWFVIMVAPGGPWSGTQSIVAEEGFLWNGDYNNFTFINM